MDTTRNKYILRSIWILFVFVGVLAVTTEVRAVDSGVLGSGNQPEVPLLVQQTSGELVKIGCEEIGVENQTRLAAVKALKWKFAIASDTATPALFACPPSASYEQLTSQGRVAGIAYAQTGGDGTEESSPLFDFILTPIINLVLWAIKLHFGITVYIIGYLMELVAWLVTVSLSFNTFVQHPAVQKMWPIVLSIANLGFMLALVVIALMTVLRLDFGGGPRRLLPRLFIGAILVNFSLVIGGLILDITKILMAFVPLITREAGNPINLNTLAPAIMEALNPSKVTLSAFYVFNGFEGLAHIIQLLLSMVVMLVVLIAMSVMAFGLIMRYVMLIVLLIISPFAYLFVAFPGMGGMANKYWVTFLKYAFYGPIALFFILAGVYSANANLFAGMFSAATPETAALMVATSNAVILGIFFYAGGTAGKFAGMLGAAAAVSIATKQGKRGAGAYLRRAGAPARLAGNEVKKVTKRGLDNVSRRSPLVDAQGKSRAGQVRDKAVDKLTGGSLTREQKAQVKQASAARGGKAFTPPMAGQRGLNSDRLQTGHVGEHLAKKDNTTAHGVARHGTRSQVRGLAGNKSFAGNLKDAEKTKFIANINANPTLVTRGSMNSADFNKALSEERTKLIDKFQDSIAKAEEDKNKPSSGKA